jgi:hypothetical protein
LSAVVAVPSAVAQSTVTVPALAADSDTVKVAVVVPASPSTTDTSSTDRDGVVGTQHVLPAWREIESTYQPVLPTLLSLLTRHRSWMVWPDADAGRLAVVVTYPPELPLHACRPGRGLPNPVLSVEV